MQISLYNLDELIQQINIDYPDEITLETDCKRNYNKKQLEDFIKNDITQNNLKYAEKERRILLYTTSLNEKIYIQYPGKYSTRNKKPYPFDFRPIAIIDGSGSSIDLSFQDIIKIIDDYIESHKEFVPVLNNLIFRLGRMCNHELKNRTYESDFVLTNGTIHHANDVSFDMYQFDIKDQKLTDSINFLARKITVGPNIDISLEAFLLYLDSLIQVEDCKFKKKAINDSHGRIATSDTLMVIYAFRLGKITLSDLLQRFVKLRGIATCYDNEYPLVSKNTIRIFNTQNRFKELCDVHNIKYTTSKTIKSKDGKDSVKISCIKLQIPEKHILITTKDIDDSSQKAFLSANDWVYYNVFNYNSDNIKTLEKQVKDAPYYFDFNYEFSNLKESYNEKTNSRNICDIAVYTKLLTQKHIILLSEPNEKSKEILKQKGLSYSTINQYQCKADLLKLFQP